MIKLDHLIFYVFFIVLAATCVFTSPLWPGGRQHKLLSQRYKRDIQGIAPAQAKPDITGPLMRLLFKEKHHLLDFLSTKNHEEKRQRQCYWSVISCY